jgi:hypothetical protein
MIMEKKFTLSALVCLLLLCAGCARYRARSLPTHPEIYAGQDHEFISATYKIFDKHDCKIYLDRNVLSYGYQPILITLKNNSKRTLVIGPHSCNFTCIDPDIVAHSVHTNTIGRAVGYGVASLFIWPLIIPAIVDGVGSAKANERLDADFECKALKTQKVNPFTSIQGLVFAHSCCFNHHIILTIQDAQTGEYIVLQDNQTSL